MPHKPLTIAMLSIHSSPLGALGTRDTGGMSVYVRALAREMGANGHRVDIFTRRQGDDDPAVVDVSPGVRLITLDIGHRGALTKHALYPLAGDYEAAVATFCRQEGGRYDLIHSHYWLSGQVGRMLRERWQRPHVISFHTLAALKTDTGVVAQASPRRLATEQALVQDSDALLAPCAGEKDNLMRYYAADPERIVLVPGGVDLDRFQPMDQKAARRRLGLDPDQWMLLSVGRLTPLKGQGRIIEALAGLKEDRRLQLIFVGGDGPQDPEQRRLQKMVARLGLEGRVIFTGSIPQKDLPDYYAAADVYVLASHYESFGLVGLEALACGRPVVSSPVGVMALLGGAQRPGCILTDGRPAGLAAGIAAVRDGSAAWPPAVIRNTVRDYSWPRTAASALQAYRQALRRGRPSPGPRRTAPVIDARRA